MAFLNHDIPTITCLIRNEYLYNHKKGHGEFTPADVHSVACIEKRVPLFEAFLENGVNWTRRPINAFCWKKDAPVRPLTEHIYWDCLSQYPDVHVRSRLAGLRAKLLTPSKEQREGIYLFTIDWAHENRSMLDTNFGETPEHKCGHVFKMDEGNYYIYPNNRILWHDNAWVFKPINTNPGYEIDTTMYTVENVHRFVTDDSYMTEFRKVE